MIFMKTGGNDPRPLAKLDDKTYTVCSTNWTVLFGRLSSDAGGGGRGGEGGRGGGRGGGEEEVETDPVQNRFLIEIF